MTELRPYQNQAIHDLRTSLANGFLSPLFVLPTGGGKTAVAAQLISNARAKAKKVLFLAPRRELIYQASQRLDESGIFYGVIMAGERRSSMPDVQVASIPTLHARCVQREMMDFPAADLVIVDEAHIGIGGRAQTLLEHYQRQGAVVIGLTATPARSDGKALGMVYDVMVQGPSVASLIADGYLVRPRYFTGTKPDLDGVRTQAGDYHQRDLGERVDEPVLIGDVVTNWARIARDRQTFVFAVNRAHSRHLAEQFLSVGVTAEHIDGETPLEDRQAIQERLRAGETQVVCNCEVMTYGVDFPPVSCIVLAAPTKSVVKYFQMVGRGLRTYPGKDDCLVIDHAGAVDGPEAIGFVEDPMPWSLSGKEKVQERKEAQRKEPKEITCGDCGEVFKAAHHCPGCGAEMVSEYKKAVEAFEADLCELNRKRSEKEKRQWTIAQKAQFFGELRAVANRRGYADGWAANQYKERLGVWPNDPRVRHVDPIEPSTETLAWVKSRLIRFAKRKEAA